MGVVKTKRRMTRYKDDERRGVMQVACVGFGCGFVLFVAFEPFWRTLCINTVS